MTYTTETTWVAGNVLTAAQLNTYVRDNVTWLATDAPTAHVFNSAAISHATSGAWQQITYDSERWDNATLHDTSSNTSRLTVPSNGAGKYVAGWNFTFAANATGDRYSRLLLTNSFTLFQANHQKDSTNIPYCYGVMTQSCGAADYMECGAFQASGGALNITVGAVYSPEFWCFWYHM